MDTQSQTPEYADPEIDEPRGRTLRRRGSTHWDKPSKRTKLMAAPDHVWQTSPAFPEWFPILPPVSSRISSPAQSRSASPTKQMDDLKNAFPSTRLSTQKTDIPAGPPRSFCESLCEASSASFIPREEEQHIDATLFLHPGLRLAAFSDELSSRQSGKIRKILRQAAKCTQQGRDGAAWCHVVRDVFRLALKTAEQEVQHAFEVIDIRNRFSQRQYLPYIIKPPMGTTSESFPRIPSRKADFCLAFDRDTTRVQDLARASRVAGSNTRLPLSHSGDVASSKAPLQCAVEVKEEDGGHLEARTQLATWHSAALIHLKDMHQQAVRSSETLDENLFQIGWVLIGHRWEPYITLVDGNDNHVNIGPVIHGPFGTNDIVQLYSLLAAIRVQLMWLLSTYWPRFRDVFTAAVEQ